MKRDWRFAPLLVSLAILVLASGCSDGDGESPGPVDMTRWQETPHVKGRRGTRKDVETGQAAFTLAGEDSSPAPLAIPRCAIHTDGETGKELPVILIQAETFRNETLAGVRYLDGRTGVCLLSELELLDRPDDRFRSE